MQEKVKQSEKDFVERVGLIREIQDEDGTVPATIRDWGITEDENCIVIEFEVDAVGELFTEKFESPSLTDKDKLIDQLLEKTGYDVMNMDTIRIDNPQVRAIPVGEEKGWSVKRWLEQLRNNDTQHVTDGCGQSWVECDRDDKMLGAIFYGLTIGFAAVPIVSVIMYLDILNSGFTQKSISSLFICSSLNILFLFLFLHVV